MSHKQMMLCTLSLKLPFQKGVNNNIWYWVGLGSLWELWNLFMWLNQERQKCTFDFSIYLISWKKNFDFSFRKIWYITFLCNEAHNGYKLKLLNILDFYYFSQPPAIEAYKRI